MVAQVAPPTIHLFPRQMRFVKSSAPFPAYIGGIGSGKSFAGGAKVISRLGRKEIGMIAAPTYQMLRDSTLEGFFQQLDMLGIPYEHLKSDNTILFAHGHKILCRSLEDPNKVRGPNLNYAWIDEGGYIDRAGWQIVKGRVRVGVQPQAWLTGTPKGRNWAWEEWERDATGDETDPTHPLFRVRTDENPELPDGFADSLGYSGRFAAQELGGEFVAFEGLVYPAFNREKAITERDCAGWRTVMGVDIGTRNPTAIYTIRVGADVERHIEREVYRRGMSSDEIIAAIEQEADSVKPETIYLDPSAASYILTLQQHGYPAQKANNEITYGIGVMTTAIAEGLTVDRSCVNFVAEIESYAFPDNKTENDKPRKESDHAMDACRYGLVGAETSYAWPEIL